MQHVYTLVILFLIRYASAIIWQEAFEISFEHMISKLISKLSNKSYKPVPKYKGNNIFGLMYTIFKNPKTGLSDELYNAAALAAKDPRGICQLSVGLQKMYLITRASHIKQILVNNAENITRTPSLESFAYAMGEHNIFSMPENDEWNQKRKLIQQWILNVDNLEKNTTPDMQQVIESVVDQTLHSSSEIDDLEKFLVTLTMEVVGKILMGTNSIIEQTTTLSHALEKAMILSISPLHNALVKISALKKYLGVPGLIGARKNLHDIYRECLLNPHENLMLAKDSLLMEIIKLEQAKTGCPDLRSVLRSKTLFSEALFLVLGGHETTSRTIQHTLILLADFPDVLQRVREEIEENRPQNNMWTREHLSKLKYLDIVLMESLRLYPPVGMISRTISKNFNLTNGSGEMDLSFSAGNKLLAPDMIIIAPYITHYLESEFELSNLFIPERFLEKKYNNFAWIPFGAGQRNCVGRNFAFKEAKEAIIKLVSDYDFEFNVHHPVSIHYQGTIKAKETIKARFSPRERSAIKMNYKTDTMSELP